MSNKLRQTFSNLKEQYAASNNIVYKNVINFLKYHGLYDETWDKCCIHKSFDKITFVLLHPLTHDDNYKLQVTFFVENSVPKFVEVYTVSPNEDTYGYHKRFDINDDRDFVFNFYINVKRSFEYTVSWDKSAEQQTETLSTWQWIKNLLRTEYM